MMKPFLVLMALFIAPIVLGGYLIFFTGGDTDRCADTSSTLATYNLCKRWERCEDLFGDSGYLYDECFNQVIVDALS